jgi:hypothetical protein
MQLILWSYCYKCTSISKSLKIPKGKSDSINRRRTDNTMAKGQKDKQRSTKHTYKTKDWVTRTPLKRGWTPAPLVTPAIIIVDYCFTIISCDDLVYCLF